ncbi:hypothetical protein [Streptomyces sp. NPDC020681]|uniref:hypothetical protein n=1 Tax=Streptomyces sp. NPDC020681 TaxID=3365083 RepID=UPI003798D4D6
MNCPTCGESSQVLRLEEFWRSLSQDAELKRDVRQPDEYAARRLIPLGLLVLAGFVLSAGDMLGLLIVVVGLGCGAFMWRATAAAQEARERWKRLLYCRSCPAQFEP